MAQASRWSAVRTMIRRASLAGLLMLGCAAAPALAHEVRPGYLEIREVQAATYDVLWKVPARGEYRLGLYAQLPASCTSATEAGSFVGGAFVARWRAHCPGGLVGQRITIDGLSATRTDVLARIEHLDGATQTTRLTPETPSFEVTATPTGAELAWTYFVLGVEHILLGVDHLLFVLGLLLLVGSVKRLIVTVTAFTVAHSITLAAATLGIVQVPQAPVEAVIALSVMFVAAEILRTVRGRPSLTARAPWVVAFVFGLLHGFGFAGALREVGLPQTDIPVALLCFNLGVEAGQLVFIAAVMALIALAGRLRPRREAPRPGNWPTEQWIRTPAAYLIGGTAAFWTVERVVGFL